MKRVNFAPFRATHQISFISRRGGEEVWRVMLTDDGVAYTKLEWREGTPADWELVKGEWRFQGGAAPTNGAVTVTKLS